MLGYMLRPRSRQKLLAGDCGEILGRCRRGSGAGRGIEGGVVLRLVLSIMFTTLMSAANVVFAQTSSGTAFAVAPEILVTNEHVVAGCSSVEIVSAGGRHKGSVVVADADIDLSVLRVSTLKGPTARLRNPRTIRLGESVMVFGYPLTGALSSDGNFTSGLVSALRGLRDAPGEIQITAPVQPGNSGGPLMDASGLVVGVVQAKLDALRTARATGDIPQNVNFAISLEVLADFLVKNRISFQNSESSAPLESARVAELAQGFTYRIECRRTSQKSAEFPSAKQRRLPSCPGSYNNGNWNNCHGVASTVTGGTYYGEFGNDMFNGLGIHLYRNGMKYVGEYKDNNRHGRGIEYNSDGSILRSGVWADDIFVRRR